ncbi:hypothetical protein BDQ17DRAFT_1420194 [Cyathus striatus]|nr:hypothetical protein BDQ17DRAFT_1420194 [Cyathus striatus]
MPVSMQVVAVVAFYMIAALVMVFVNKTVLNSSPELATLFMFFQSIATVLLLNFTALFTSQVQIPTLNYGTARKLTPLIAIDACGFIFGALCLRDVEAAFYQIARGLVLPLTIFIVSLSSSSRPSLSIVACASIVTLGFFLGITFQHDLPEKAMPTPLALFYGFLSSLSIALHAVLVKSSLPHVNGSSTMLSYWSNLGSAILLGGLALLQGEVTRFIAMMSDSTWDWKTFLWGNIVTGIFGFLISIAGILSVKVTSPSPTCARSVLQVFLGVKIFGDIVTRQRIISLITILCGTLLYTYVKSQETPAPSPPPTLPRVAKDIESPSISQQRSRSNFINHSLK